MSEWKDAPAWLIELVRDGVWNRSQWASWELWRKTLEDRGIEPDMLVPVGDPRRPLAMSIAGPNLAWRSTTIEWDKYNRGDAILYALLSLVGTLDDSVKRSGT